MYKHRTLWSGNNPWSGALKIKSLQIPTVDVRGHAYKKMWTLPLRISIKWFLWTLNYLFWHFQTLDVQSTQTMQMIFSSWDAKCYIQYTCSKYTINEYFRHFNLLNYEIIKTRIYLCRNFKCLSVTPCTMCLHLHTLLYVYLVTICPRSPDPFSIWSNFINCAKTSSTFSIVKQRDFGISLVLSVIC